MMMAVTGSHKSGLRFCHVIRTGFIRFCRPPVSIHGSRVATILRPAQLFAGTASYDMAAIDMVAIDMVVLGVKC